MKENDLFNYDHEKFFWVEFPYVGIGEKPISNKKQKLTDEQLEKIIGG